MIFTFMGANFADTMARRARGQGCARKGKSFKISALIFFASVALARMGRYKGQA
jgi:hypothetical protein